MNPLESLYRSSVVGFAMLCDIFFNYPLWITAKRIGANLSPFPKKFRMIYQGGGTLWLSLGPTTIIEDLITRILQQQSNSEYLDMICAASSGVVAALMITSQVEHLITSSHVHNTSVINTFLRVYRDNPRKILLPPGMMAMVGREVPFATALFYFRPLIAEKFDPIDHATMPWYQQFYHDLQYGFLTSLIATPISHPASVIASYQQGHDLPLQQSIRHIATRYGWKGFFNGLLARTLSLTGTFTVVPIVLRIFSSKFEDEEHL